MTFDFSGWLYAFFSSLIGNHTEDWSFTLSPVYFGNKWAKSKSNKETKNYDLN